MAYIKRISDGAIFEVFGLVKLDLREERVFLIWDRDEKWHWAPVSEYEPIEELVPDDFEDNEEDTAEAEQEDIKEDKL